MNKPYRAIAGELKKLGLVSYDLRQSLNSGQKAQITKLAKEYGHVLKHPDQFHTPKVGKETAKTLKTAGFKVTKTGRAIIPLSDGTGGHYQKANIKGGRILFSRPGRREDVYLAGSAKFFKELKRIGKKKLPRNARVSVRIGDGGAFSHNYMTYADLYKYLSEEFVPKDPGESKQRLLSLMSVVYVTDDAYDQKPRSKPRAKKKAYNHRRN